MKAVARIFAAAIISAALAFAPVLAFAQTTPSAPSASMVKFVLTSTSATSCTTLMTNPINVRMLLVSVYNTGATTTIHPQFFDDTKCSVAANAVFGDNSAITIPAGLTTLNVPLNTGLSYTLGSALSATENLIILAEGIGF